MKVLDVGSGEKSLAADFFGEEAAEIVRLDVDDALNPDIIHDITKPFPKEYHNTFDAVFASHVLEHIARNQVHDTMRNLWDVLVENGELWVVVPDLLWAAEQIVKHEATPTVVQGVLYGGQWNEWQYHKTGFCILDLRDLFDLSGYIMRQAYRAPFTITVNVGEAGERDVMALQNIAVGAKVSKT